MIAISRKSPEIISDLYLSHVLSSLRLYNPNNTARTQITHAELK